MSVGFDSGILIGATAKVNGTTVFLKTIHRLSGI
jgi:hypothetical protein